jgi:hypothetical protein
LRNVPFRFVVSTAAGDRIATTKRPTLGDHADCGCRRAVADGRVPNISGLAVGIGQARKSMVVVIRVSYRTSHHQQRAAAQQREWQKMSAIDWEFSVRVSNVLRDAGIDTHEKLLNLTDRELLCLPNFGKRSLDEIWEYRRKQPDKIRDGALVKRFLSRINSLTRQVENLRRENRRLLADLEKAREQSGQVTSRARELAD